MDKKNTKDKFEFFDVTADVGFRAYGESLNESFENSALAMFEVMTDTSQINPIEKREIDLESEDEKGLLYDWLSELLFLHDYKIYPYKRNYPVDNRFYLLQTLTYRV